MHLLTFGFTIIFEEDTLLLLVDISDDSLTFFKAVKNDLSRLWMSSALIMIASPSISLYPVSES
jgi:hypothetical protein